MPQVWSKVSDYLPTETDAVQGNVICIWEDEAVETYWWDRIDEWNEDHPYNQIIYWAKLPKLPRKVVKK